MKKLIVVEGTDNVGKSTFIRNLEKHIGRFTKFHFTSPKNYNYRLNPTIAQEKQFIEIFDKTVKTSGTVVWDRSHIGEHVYAPLYRDRNDTSWVMKLEYNYKELFRNSIGVLLVSNPNHLSSNDDGLSYSNLPQSKQREQEYFINALKKTNIPFIIIDVFDIETNNFRNIDDIVKEFLDEYNK